LKHQDFALGTTTLSEYKPGDNERNAARMGTTDVMNKLSATKNIVSSNDKNDLIEEGSR
jgi:hypothetical protein